MITSQPPALPASGRSISSVLQAWREETLASVVSITMLVSLPAMVAASLASVRRGHAIYLLAPLASLALLAWLTFDRRLPYRARTYGILGVLSISGASALISLGPDGVGRLYVIAAIFLAAAMLPWREMAVAWAVIGLAMVAILGGLAAGNLRPAPGALALPAGPEVLLANAVVFLWFALAVCRPLVAIVARLTGALVAAEEALVERDNANTTLERMVEERTDALRSSQALLQGVLDNSPAAIYVKDLAGRYLLTNRYMHRVHGLPDDGMRGRRDVELFGASASPWRSHERAVIEGGLAVAAEAVTPHTDGPHTYYEIKFPLRDAAGAITAIGGIAADITERKLADEALARQRSYAQALTFCSGALLAQVDADAPDADALMDALEHLRSAVGCRRAYLYQLRPDPAGGLAAHARVEVCAPGVTSDPRTGLFPSGVFPHAIVADLRLGRPALGPIDDLLAPSPAYRAALDAAGVAAVLMMPVQVMGELWGVLGLSDGRPAPTWGDDELQMLQTAAEMVAAFIQSRQILQSLRERDHFIQRVADASPDMLYVFDLRERRNVFANREVASSLGYDDRDIAAFGDNFLREVLLPEDFARMADFQARSLAAHDNEVVEFEYRVRRKDGELRWLLSREVIFARDEAGRPTQVLGLARDITVSKESHLEMERREALLRTISDALPNGYLYQVIQRRDGSYVRYTYVSRGIEPILGVTPEQVLADHSVIRDIVHPEEQAALDLADSESARTLTMFGVELRARKPDGSYGWFQVRSVPQLLPDGLVLWNGICLEVTQRKQIELALQEANGLLRRRIGELAALNQLAQALMGWTDLPEAIRTVGPLLHELFRAEGVAVWLRSERGDTLSQLTVVVGGKAMVGGPTVRLRRAPLARAALQSRQVQILDDGRADPVLLPPLDPRPDAPHSVAMMQPILVRNAPIGLLVVRGGPGATITPSNVELAQTVAGLLSSAIENGRLMQKTMAAAAAEERRRLARELHDSVTQQLAGLTLLAPSWAKLAARGHTDEVGDWFRQVETTALQALREMRLLIYQLRSEDLDGLGLVVALRRRVEAVEGRAGVQVSLEVDEDLPRLSPEHEAELFAIAQEALNNAARHAYARAVSVTLRREAARLSLAVRDDGRGFDPAAPSAGLGMTTMRERAERIGGAWTITSAQGAGTTITVTVPLKPASRRTAGRASSRSTP